MDNKRRASLLLLGLIPGLLGYNVAAKGKQTFEAYLTAEAKNNTPGLTRQDQFECADKIYVVIDAVAPGEKKSIEHLLVVNWFNPGDRLEQKTRFTFSSYGKGRQVWAWLKLSGSTGSSIGQIFDPSYGMDKFIGKWRVKIVIDNKKLATLPFDVLC